MQQAEGFNRGGQGVLRVDDQAGQRSVHFAQVEQSVERGLSGTLQGPFGDDLGEVFAQEAGLRVAQFDQRRTQAPDNRGTQIVVVGLGLIVNQQEGFVEAAQ